MLDAVLPPLCLGCGEIVETPGALCAACWPGFAFIAPPYCARCAYPFVQQVGEGALCGACAARPPRYRRARAALVYDDKSRKLVLPFKHGDRTDIARACGGWMARAGADLLAEADLVAPVPLHWRRLFTRRYNQAPAAGPHRRRRGAVDAGPAGPRPAAARGAGPARRPGWRPSSATTTSGRPSTSIRAGPRRSRARSVLLIDDVLTTGATVEACARALQRGGARHVDVLTLARVVRPAV